MLARKPAFAERLRCLIRYTHHDTSYLSRLSRPQSRSRGSNALNCQLLTLCIQPSSDMKYSVVVIVLALSWCTSILQAQPPVKTPDPNASWRTLYKEGQTLESLGDLHSATLHYIAAVNKKPKKTEIAYQAGRMALDLRLYQEAISMLELVRGDKKYPKASLYYAQALKATGDYANALLELESFGNVYAGDDYQEVTALAQVELDGCRLAIDAGKDKSAIGVSRPADLNTSAQEIAPVRVAERMILLTTNRKNDSYKVFGSSKEADNAPNWPTPQSDRASLFTTMNKKHFGAGNLSNPPMGNRFYFMQCEIDKQGRKMCELYYQQATLMPTGEKKWSSPIALPNTINSRMHTSEDPFVIERDGGYVIYFSSDRAGSRGGKDIWYTTSPKDGLSTDHTPPVNLGSFVNTPYDEVSPSYDTLSRSLFFSSKGHPGMGGFDVFQTSLSSGQATDIRPLPAPINSSADDYYYSADPFHPELAYFASNRSYGKAKISTLDDDIFIATDSSRMRQTLREITVTGKIYPNDNPSITVTNATIIYAEKVNNRYVPAESFVTSDGYFSFIAIPGVQYQITVEHPSYEPAELLINTDDYADMEEIIADIALQRKGGVPTDVVRTDVPGSMDIDPNLPPTTGKVPGTSDPVVTVPGSKPTPGDIVPVPGGDRTDPVPTNDPDPNVVDVPTTTLPDDAPNADNIIGTLNMSELTSNQFDAIEVFDGDPYLAADNGQWYKIENKFNADNNFPSPGSNLGSHYRIQLAAVSRYKAEKFANTDDVGTLATETTIMDDGNEVTRVMLMPFSNFELAKSALRKLRAKGYDRAFIIRYENDQRMGRMIRNID